MLPPSVTANALDTYLGMLLLNSKKKIGSTAVSIIS